MSGQASVDTGRLTLAVPSDSDLEHVFRIHSDLRTYRHHPDGLMTTIVEARTVLGRWIDDWSEHQIGYRVMRLRESRMVIGFAGVRLVQSPGFSPGAVLNVYYRLDPDHWHHGYASEAAAAVIQEAGEVYPEVPIVARVALVNESSLAVARSLGMLPTPWQDPDDAIPHQIFRMPSNPAVTDVRWPPR